MASLFACFGMVSGGFFKFFFCLFFFCLSDPGLLLDFAWIPKFWAKTVEWLALTLVQYSIIEISDIVNVLVIFNCCLSSISTNSLIPVFSGGKSGWAVAFSFHSFYLTLNTFHSEVSVTLSHNETGVITLAQFSPVVHTGATSTCLTFHRAHLIT